MEIIRTSILERFTPALCDIVIGREFIQSNRTEICLATDMISKLRKENLFLIPIDDNWYRYHNLFSEFLQKELEKELPEKVRMLNRNAAFWFMAKGLLHEAFEYALASEDAELLDELAGKYSEELWIAGEHARLLQKLQEIPGDVLDSNVELRLYIAWLKMNKGQVAEAMNYVKSIEKINLSEKELGMMETILAYYGNITGQPQMIIVHGKRALDIFNDKYPLWKSSVLVIMGYGYSLKGNMPEIENCFREALDLSQLCKNRYFSLLAGFNLAYTLYNMGRLEEAKNLCENQLGGLKGYQFEQLSRTGGHYALLAEIACEENEMASALKYGLKSVELCEKDSNKAALCFAYITLFRIYYALKEWNDAETTLYKITDLREKVVIPDWLNNMILICQVSVLIGKGQIKKAMQLLPYEGIMDMETIPYLRESKAFILARILITMGRNEEAEEIIMKLKDVQIENKRMTNYLHCIICQAAYREQEKRGDEAEELLVEALDISAEKGYFRIFLEMGPFILPIIERMKEKQSLSIYGLQIMTAIKSENQKNVLVDLRKRREKIESISSRELEILQLLPLDMGYPEIADRLFISYSTVRSHVKNIYMKLEAHSRLEAIHLARKLGLIK
ncbi:MAG: LuxR C-terminal-related transcriptional regulator [Halanaerobiales bacterium]